MSIESTNSYVPFGYSLNMALKSPVISIPKRIWFSEFYGHRLGIDFIFLLLGTYRLYVTEEKIKDIRICDEKNRETRFG
jgi:hypothetical protein